MAGGQRVVGGDAGGQAERHEDRLHAQAAVADMGRADRAADDDPGHAGGQHHAVGDAVRLGLAAGQVEEALEPIVVLGVAAAGRVAVDRVGADGDRVGLGGRPVLARRRARVMFGEDGLSDDAPPLAHVHRRGPSALLGELVGGQAPGLGVGAQALGHRLVVGQEPEQAEDVVAVLGGEYDPLVPVGLGPAVRAADQVAGRVALRVVVGVELAVGQGQDAEDVGQRLQPAQLDVVEQADVPFAVVVGRRGRHAEVVRVAGQAEPVTVGLHHAVALAIDLHHPPLPDIPPEPAGVLLAKLVAALAADAVIGAGHRGQVALVAGVDEQLGRQHAVQPAAAVGDDHAASPSVMFGQADQMRLAQDGDRGQRAEPLAEDLPRDLRLEVEPAALELLVGVVGGVVVGVVLVDRQHEAAERAAQGVDRAEVGPPQAAGDHPAQRLGRLDQQHATPTFAQRHRRGDAARRRAIDDHVVAARVRGERLAGRADDDRRVERRARPIAPPQLVAVARARLDVPVQVADRAGRRLVQQLVVAVQVVGGDIERRGPGQADSIAALGAGVQARRGGRRQGHEGQRQQR